MNTVFTSFWIPIFIVLFVLIPHQAALKEASIILKRKKKRGKYMTNELIQKFLGKQCHISTGALGSNVAGKIIQINENWIEVETRNDNVIMNLDFIQSIKVRNK